MTSFDPKNSIILVESGRYLLISAVTVENIPFGGKYCIGRYIGNGSYYGIFRPGISVSVYRQKTSIGRTLDLLVPQTTMHKL